MVTATWWNRIQPTPTKVGLQTIETLIKVDNFCLLFFYKDESFWDNGFGALSNVKNFSIIKINFLIQNQKSYFTNFIWNVWFSQLGKRQQYELGKFLRAKYSKLIGTRYSPQRVYIRSTDEERNLQSAQCNAAGMFPPSGDEVWNKQLAWQPIPIHTIPLSDDYLLNSFVPCPRFDQMFRQRMESHEIKSLLENHTELVDFMERGSGKLLPELVDVLNLYNILFVESLKGLEWVLLFFLF